MIASARHLGSWRYEHAGDALLDDLWQRSHVGDDARQAGRARFQERHAKTFEQRGEHEDVGRAHQGRDVLAAPEKADRRAKPQRIDLGTQLLLEKPHADDQQLRMRVRRRTSGIASIR